MPTISQSVNPHNDTSGRRRLLGQTLSVASAFACFSQLPPRESRAANEKLKLGFVGVGNRGRNNLIPMRGEDVFALCDVDQNHLDQRGNEFPAAKKYRDFREMLQAVKLDGLVISAPNHIHAVATTQALQRGMHVYCEKPLTHNMSEIWRVRDLAKRKSPAAKGPNLVTQMGNQHHSSIGYQQAIAILRRGLLGRVREVHSWTSKPFWPQGRNRPRGSEPIPRHLNWDLWLGPAAKRPYNSCYTPLRWRGWWDFGGGVLGDMGPHLLDPIVAGLQLGEPNQISAKTDKRFLQTAPKWSIVNFQFPAVGQRSAVSLTWYDGGKQPPRQQTKIARLPPNGSLVIGEKARLFIPQLGAKPILLDARNKRLRTPKIKLPPLVGHHQQWLSACRGRGTTTCNFQYASTLTAICMLGNIAVRMGKTFRWDAKTRRASVASAQPFLGRSYRQGWKLK